MSLDQWLQAPYVEQGLRDAKIEVEAERIFAAYDRKEMFADFLVTLGEEIKDDNPILAAVKQRDYEAIGGLLMAAFEEHLSELADADAERLSGW